MTSHPAGLWGLVSLICVKFRDPPLNCSGEIRPKAVGCGIFGRFFLKFDKSRPEVAGDITSVATLEYVGMESMQKLVILSQIVLEIQDCLTL